MIEVVVYSENAYAELAVALPVEDELTARRVAVAAAALLGVPEGRSVTLELDGIRLVASQAIRDGSRVRLLTGVPA